MSRKIHPITHLSTGATLLLLLVSLGSCLSRPDISGRLLLASRFAITGFGSLLFNAPLAKAEVTITNQHQATFIEQDENDIVDGPQSIPAPIQQQPVHKQIHYTQSQLHPSLLVDVKYWSRSTEFGVRDNWLNKVKPCTLLEKITFNEQSVVSMGDSLDRYTNALESSIKNLVLAMDGVLLLEPDSQQQVSSSSSSDLPPLLDPTYLQYLNQSGDCLYLTDDQRAWFHFQPESDDLSWFNPGNWVSSFNDVNTELWAPESHRVPCNDDVVIFGSRHSALAVTLSGDEFSELLTFKVNFKPSQALMDDFIRRAVKIDKLRVGKLKIGKETYDQQQFNRLIGASSPYENILFEFSSNGSLLPDDDSLRLEDLLTIDGSSISTDDTSLHVCQDEAGCLCGNEDANIMSAVCSFNHPLEPADLPCHDPIASSGYCNKICATVLLIRMDPTKFSERFLAHTFNVLLSDVGEASTMASNVFVASRRVYEDEYEITFRLVPDLDQWDDRIVGSYDNLIGQDRQMALSIRDQLNKDSIKSFYGIKSITLKSSINWRYNNRDAIYYTTIFALALVLIVLDLILAKPTEPDTGRDAYSTPTYNLRSSLAYVGHLFGLSVQNVAGELEPIVATTGSFDRADLSSDQIQLVGLEEWHGEEPRPSDNLST